ncbi:RNA polymerase subunit sigma-70, partial [Mesorhizobium sp. YM1C-6-2]
MDGRANAARAAAEAAAESAARASYGKLVAYLAARSRDVAGAEDALSEAFAAALAQWPR